MPTQDEIKELFSYSPETGVMKWKAPKTNRVQPGSELKTLTNGYYSVGIGKKQFYVHRLAWKYMHGTEPEYIDHEDQNKLNNKIDNLRSIPKRINHTNMKKFKTNTSGTTGVYFNKSTNKWCSQICVEGKMIYLGLFNEKQDAIRTRQEANEKFLFHKNHGLEK